MAERFGRVGWIFAKKKKKIAAMDRWKDGYFLVQSRMYVASQDTKKHLIKFVSLSHLCKRAKESKGLVAVV